MTKHKQLAIAEEGKDMADMIGYLRSCSDAMLQQFEMARLNTSANLTKDLSHIMQQAVTDLAEALLARTLLEHRKTLVKVSAAPFQSAQEIMADLVPMLPEASGKPVKGKKRG